MDLMDFEPEVMNLAEKLYEAGDDPNEAIAKAWAITEHVLTMMELF